jgi:hypothetical protein
MNIEIVKATEDDIDDIYNIIVECTYWLNDIEIKQWRTVYPRERFEKDTKKGVVYKFIMSRNGFGTVTLYEDQPAYYPINIFEHKTNTWYICRLAISRNTKYRGMGSNCMKLIEELALSKEIVCLRLDVTKLNPFLGAYYHNLSYKSIAEAEIFGEDTLFMEKSILTNNSTRPPTSVGEF